MLKISRVYMDACGYRDGVFEELSIKPLDQSEEATHHIIHAPNGIGKTTILALLFSTFEPDRRKFLRTEINRQHKMEHYFLSGRLGVVAIELIKQGANKRPIRHVIGQVFWLTPASKGDDGEPGHRRFFAFESGNGLALETLPFRGLSGPHTLRTLEDFVRWARETRTLSPGNFFSTESPGSWRKYLVAELGLDPRVIEVQRRFCAAEGGIGAAFLDFRTEQQFLEKIFSFMIPEETAESVVQALETGLSKIRDLPQRKDQLKALIQLEATFGPFFATAAELEAAECEHVDDLKHLGRLYSRLKTDIAKLEVQRATTEGELALTAQRLEDAQQLERKLEGEVLFFDKTAAERRIENAKAVFEKAKVDQDAWDRKRRAAAAAALSRRLASAEQVRLELEAELDRIEHDLAPDRARLERAGACVHALLDRLATEAEGDAVTQEAAATLARDQAEVNEQTADAALEAKHKLAAELDRLNRRVEEYTRERKSLEKIGAFYPNEAPETAIARLSGELSEQEDVLAGIDLADEQLQTEATSLEGMRRVAGIEASTAKKESERLDKLVVAGLQLEARIVEHEVFAVVLAGDTKDPYRLDIVERVRAAKASREEIYRTFVAQRNSMANELAFLDAEGVSSVPEDVVEVVQALNDAGYRGVQPAEHYLAAFKPDADAAMALVRQDPARFTGVFVAGAERDKLSALAAENRLKLRGPVVVSAATLEPRAWAIDESAIVFGPLSAARFNKQAAVDEKDRLKSVLAQKEADLLDQQEQLDRLQSLIDDLRRLQEAYSQRRPNELARDKHAADAQQIDAEGRIQAAIVRSRAIVVERGHLKSNRTQVTTKIVNLTSWKQDLDRFAVRYVQIGDAIARIPIATAERAQKEIEAEAARATAESARSTATGCDRRAAGLRAIAAARRSDKQHYPETDGSPTDPIGTLADLSQQYKDAEHMLASKRDAQGTRVSLRLTDVRRDIVTHSASYADAMLGLTAVDLEAFADIADLDRAIADAESAYQLFRSSVEKADGAVNVANAKSGPVVKRIDEAKERRGVTPIVVPEFLNATVETCESERDAREMRRDAAEKQFRLLGASNLALQTQLNDIKGSLASANSLLKRAGDHLPEAYRSELPDLSFGALELEDMLGQLIERLTEAFVKANDLRKVSEGLFDKVRQILTAESFRRLEPQVAENLMGYSARSASTERLILQTRLAERIAVVQTEIDNQQRDQNACLEQLRQHVIHADDLLRRAVRCSKLPDNVPNYGGERILKVKRMLRDVSRDIVQHQLALWLDEQAVSGRIPRDGAALAAELLSRIHGGRALDIEILKPKREAIEPYMRVDRMGVSGGEGVTVAMMLYTVIQKMAMDERADDKNASSGGFLMLDNTYGMSNMMEHVVLQMTMANMLGIQLLVTTCSEDKHVLNMFPTITRLVQGERVFSNGVPLYIRVRAADYLLKDSGYAA